jgi:tripartite-type tricarboxylate transporter receptor subunit TctC
MGGGGGLAAAPRRLLHGGISAISTTLAQGWPTRAVTLLVPSAPGGAGDFLGRILASRLSELLGRQVIVENIGGAGDWAY